MLLKKALKTPNNHIDHKFLMLDCRSETLAKYFGLSFRFLKYDVKQASVEVFRHCKVVGLISEDIF